MARNLLEIAKPYVLEGAVPGQSLTNAPDQPYPWEGPPEITSQKEAINRIFLDIIKPGNIEVLSDLMANDIPIANIAEMLIKTGFQKGKYNPDLAITLMEPTMFMLLSDLVVDLIDSNSAINISFTIWIRLELISYLLMKISRVF